MSKKALVVDNDSFFVEFLTALLEKRQYEVIKAHDGKEGILKLEEGPFDVMFVDLVMPKIDGKEFIGSVRKKFSQGDFPIAAVSATLVEQVDRIFEIGATHYIVKGPLAQMEARIIEFLDKIESGPFSEYSVDLSLAMEEAFPVQPVAELLETVDFYRAIIESAGVGLIVIDKDAKVIKANSLALDMLGRPIEDILNESIVDLFHGEEKAKVISALRKVVHNRELDKITSLVTLNSRQMILFTSLLKIDDKSSGWIIAMDDVDNLTL